MIIFMLQKRAKSYAQLEPLNASWVEDSKNAFRCWPITCNKLGFEGLQVRRVPI